MRANDDGRGMRILITGAAGFIGSHFVAHFRDRHPDWEIVVIDSLNYAGAYDRLAAFRQSIRTHYHDLRAPMPDYLVDSLGPLDHILHLAAETHVDKSLTNPRPFVESNVLGTFNLLEYARLQQPALKMFFYISTDEVYGPAPPGIDHDEECPHRPSNPYSATKAGAEDLVYAWTHSMGVSAIVTDTMNNIGETQHREKYVPKIIRAILTDSPIPVHGQPGALGSRKYLYARDHADAIDFLMVHGESGAKYNVVGQEEIDNLEMVQRIERIMGRQAKVELIDFHLARPGHDRRYSLDGSKMAALGWLPPTPIDEALKKTVQWYLENPDWLGLAHVDYPLEISVVEGGVPQLAGRRGNGG